MPSSSVWPDVPPVFPGTQHTVVRLVPRLGLPGEKRAIPSELPARAQASSAVSPSRRSTLPLPSPLVGDPLSAPVGVSGGGDAKEGGRASRSGRRSVPRSTRLAIEPTAELDVPCGHTQNQFAVRPRGLRQI